MSDQSQLLIKWFAELGIGDRPTAGGKGASLGELVKAGAKVPSGFVITTAAFEAFLENFDPDKRVRCEITHLKYKSHDEIDSATRSIRENMLNAPLPAELHEAIWKAYTELSSKDGHNPVAVRSSATSEDNADASFAGLQDTYLWINGPDAVIENVKRCWSSLYSLESVTYRLRLGLDEDEVAMAVVVQDMVDARTAGVMFTRSPVTGDRTVVVLEAAWGVGSAVVNGEVTPDRFVVNKITGEITQRKISQKLVKHIPDYERGTMVEVEVADDEQLIPSVSDEELQMLTRTARSLEKHYGNCQDIEWAISRDDGGIMLLQCRPETVWSGRDKEKAPVVEAANPLAHVIRALTDRG
ncbi:PEP/pyruvate-binding domain-containing protein [Rhizobium leguminosarum]